MATYNKFQQFVENIAKGVHNFTSDATCTLTVALCTNAAAPIATNSVLADLTQISYTNLSSRVITGVTAEHAAGVLSVTAADLILTASGAVATFRWVVIYDDDPTSPADPLICFFDKGVDVTLQAGETLTIDFPTNLFTLT